MQLSQACPSLSCLIQLRVLSAFPSCAAAVPAGQRRFPSAVSRDGFLRQPAFHIPTDVWSHSETFLATCPGLSATFIAAFYCWMCCFNEQLICPHYHEWVFVEYWHSSYPDVAWENENQSLPCESTYSTTWEKRPVDQHKCFGILMKFCFSLLSTIITFRCACNPQSHLQCFFISGLYWFICQV